MKDTAVLGLGIIGSLWARHYDAAGRLAAAWNRTRKSDAPRSVATPYAAGESANIIHIVVADPAAVEGVLTNLQPALTKKHLVIQSSTIDPASAERFADLVRGCGARYIEAPFTGSRPAAESKQLVFYLGGSDKDLDLAEPTLELLSATRLRIGTIAQAASLKLAMNLQLAIQMQGICESLAFARRAGIDDDVYFGAYALNAGYSGLTKLKEPKLRAADWAPQFSVKHMLKDMRLALRSTREAPLPFLKAIQERLNAAHERGWGELDFSALYRNLE